MVGQQHIIQTLQNAIREQRTSHAYLFSGPRGTGKTSAAKILAKAVNCERGPAPEPCNECEACRRITTGAVMDVQEIDAASNRGVEEIRDLREKVKYAPTEVRQKVYIIDEVHMLTTEAFNALLKTLEEPPPHFAKLATSLLKGDVGHILQMIEGFMHEGKSADKCMENLLYYFRDLLMIKMVPDADKLTDRVLNPESFRDMAESFTKEQLFQMIDTLNRYQSEMKYAVQPQTLFEVALLKLCSIPAQGATSGQVSGSVGTAPAVSSPADGGEINRLKQQLAELEKKLDRALKGGLSGGEAASNAPSRPATRAPVSRGNSPAKLPAQLDQYVARKGSPEFVEVSKKWGQILQRVKEEKVTVHAWFMDGEPVSLLEDNVLVAFKNNIHRETTEKQANREVIERVLSEQLGRSARLVTMMLKDWTGAMEGATETPKEDFKLEPEHEDGGSGNKQPWIDEAIQLFGEDLVVIKE
ncbi:hypothetical protein G195_006876 [Phytophthora kernoviae 00238/432]|uniref:DNA-directed DNA polymerase n=1 Tax=Phytophthora kernoviae 00238/432 TaxID=1284355 RepID=A0A8J4WEL4_9STRA|nr:hypothetical protein G195_006876 [Phytophthora kernoviae 00238/432]